MSTHQRSVDQYFKGAVGQWREIYELPTLFARIHQERRSIVLSMAENIALSAEAPVLEIGCGAGLTAVALAQRGFPVEAVDTVRDMLLSTMQRAANAAVTHRVRVTQASVDHLPYGDNHFSLVIAMGVLPWLASMKKAMEEVIRVTKPGGHLIVNVDNAWRLHELLDPRLHPLHAPIRRHLRNTFGSSVKPPPTQRCTPRQFDRLIRKLGCDKVDAKMLGFGPLSFFGRPLFSESVNIKLHNYLQSCADRRFPIFRSTGAQYIVLFRKDSGSRR